VRILLDEAPAYVIPAQVSFVASVAQFTPKTVETASECLMSLTEDIKVRYSGINKPDLLLHS